MSQSGIVEQTAMLKKLTNYDENRRWAALKKNISKYYVKSAITTKEEITRDLAQFFLKKDGYLIRKQDALRQYSELFDDEKIDINKNLFMLSEDISQYERDIQLHRDDLHKYHSSLVKDQNAIFDKWSKFAHYHKRNQRLNSWSRDDVINSMLDGYIKEYQRSLNLPLENSVRKTDSSSDSTSSIGSLDVFDAKDNHLNHNVKNDDQVMYYNVNKSIPSSSSPTDPIIIINQNSIQTNANIPENKIICTTPQYIENPNQTIELSKIYSSWAANMELIIKDSLQDLDVSKEIRLHKSSRWDHYSASSILLIHLLARDFKFEITTSSRKSKSQPKNWMQDFYSKHTRSEAPNKWKKISYKNDKNKFEEASVKRNDITHHPRKREVKYHDKWREDCVHRPLKPKHLVLNKTNKLRKQRHRGLKKKNRTKNHSYRAHRELLGKNRMEKHWIQKEKINEEREVIESTWKSLFK